MGSGSAGHAHGSLRLRLLGEFVVIVVGVLVALAANAAWEVRVEHRQEEDYYRSLAHDLVADTAEYGLSLRMTARSMEAARHVRSAIRGDATASTRSLARSVAFASWVNFPDWSSGTVDELFSAGTIRLIRDPGIKNALHEYRASIAEWRPRMQGPEYDAYLDYRRQTAGWIPLEASIAFMVSRLDNEGADDRIDEAALARRLRGNEALLNTTELMIVQWSSLSDLFEEQRDTAIALLRLLEQRVGT